MANVVVRPQSRTIPGLGALERAGAGIRRLMREPLGAAGALMIAFLIFVALFAPIIMPYDPLAFSADILEGPSFKHPFGTDDIGRDQMSRAAYGARISLQVGLIAAVLGVGSGSILGLVSGFAGGKFDLVVQRFVDGVQAIPGLVMAMALVSILGPSTRNALLAIAIVIIPGASRVIRSSALAEKQRMYVESARSLGASPARVVFRHLLPNVTAPIFILVSASLGGAILVEAGLSFLGLGTQPPTPSWGSTLSRTGRQYIEVAPWIAIAPGVAISLTVLAFNLFGDALRDILDPRLRGSR